ncbi:MAG: YggU family protein [Verrucomicrobia bacterium]|nr:MAG: YggU family protein [Verrucomicrobiota bacterium]
MSTIRVHILPNAKVDKVVGDHGDAIKIKLRAPAMEGKANAALIRFLAAQLGILPRQIALMRGQKSRDKLIRIKGLSEREVQERLGVRN